MDTKKYYIGLLFMFMLVLPRPANAQRILHGKIIDAITKKPIAGASITAVKTNKGMKSSQNGLFAIDVEKGDTLLCSALNYAPKRVSVDQDISSILIALQPKSTQLEEVQVISTGYQKIPKERATGSFDLIDNRLFNRSVSTDVLSRLENVVPGLLYNRGDAEDTDPFLIRGRSTITGDAQPLIVLDGFPFDGDLNNINPNDIENVSILKDAAAASIWGARAGNGVIVLTTKRGKGHTPRIEMSSSITFREKPDIFNISRISSADRVELEKFLFKKGRYASSLTGSLNGNTNSIPSAVELMIADPSDLDSQLERLKHRDVRSDLQNYFYRTSLNQQHSLNISGAQEKINYYLSAGYDKELANKIGESKNRISLRSATTFKVNRKLQFDAAINYVQTNNEAGNNPGTNIGGGGKSLSPYTSLVDEKGNSLPVYLDLRKGYVDTAGNGLLMDWNYRPLDDIGLENHNAKTRDYLVNVGSTYNILKGLKASVKYQYQNQLLTNTDQYAEDSFYARNLINYYTQINSGNGEVSRPIPLGGIMDANHEEVSAHQGRVQVDYDKSWKKHALVTLAGYEIRSKNTKGNSYRYYGYNDQYSTINRSIDYVTRFKQYANAGTRTIPAGVSLPVSQFNDHFLSYFANMAYTYDNRYTLSGSFRKDEANLFGVKTNQKGTPLWSIGGAWRINDEPFFNVTAIPFLKMRMTYGVNGNISRSASAYTTVAFSSGGITHSLPSAFLRTPPNESLRWERVKMLNVGLDFRLKGEVLSGTIEYYNKKAVDLLAETPADPTLGFSSVFANTASMKAKGFDIQLGSKNIDRRLKWTSTFIYSYSRTTVTDYLMPVSTRGYSYRSASSINPIMGKPLYSVYSYQWAGLDPNTGDPLSYINGKPSKDYNAIYDLPLDSMVYHGPLQPVHYGALRNEVSYKNITLSFNISYKFGAFFRSISVDNDELINGWSGHGDYARRWQQPGDELITYVPSVAYPQNDRRQRFYTNSSILVQKADNVRLEDISISYGLILKEHSAFRSMRIFVYASDLGMLWKANNIGTDPYYNNIVALGKRIAVGISLTF